MQITTIYVKDLTGTLKVVWFRMPFLRNMLSKGGAITLRGRILRKKDQLVMQHPEIFYPSSNYEEKQGTCLLYTSFSLIKGKILYRNQRFKWRMRLLWKRLPGQGEKKRPVEKSLYREEKASCDSDIFEKDTVEVHEKSEKFKRETSDREQAETGGRKPKRFSFKKIYEKIRYTIIKICDNIKILLKKKECIED